MTDQGFSQQSTITPIPEGAVSYIAGLAAALSTFEYYYCANITDIMGGSKAGQWGMVSIAAHWAVKAGIDTYLFLKGFSSHKLSRVIPENLLRLKRLAIAVGEDSDLFRRAHTLEMANPDTPEEIVEYACQCYSYVEEGLGLKWLRSCYSQNYSDEHVRRVSRYYGFFEFQERHSIPAWATVESTRNRWDVHRKFAPQHYRETRLSAYALLEDRGNL